MGVVYKARQKALDRLVALKILAPEREKDPEFAARFAREAKTPAQLNHPNIVTVYEFGESHGMFFFAMDNGYQFGDRARACADDHPRAL